MMSLTGKIVFFILCIRGDLRCHKPGERIRHARTAQPAYVYESPVLREYHYHRGSTVGLGLSVPSLDRHGAKFFPVYSWVQGTVYSRSNVQRTHGCRMVQTHNVPQHNDHAEPV